MDQQNKTTISKDPENKKIIVVRQFNATVEKVWKSWTDAEQLDLWWAPKPWKARTKTMDFREGGFWLYAMVGPNGEEHWARIDFESIDPHKSFTAADYFCDENGNKSDALPEMQWKNTFSPAGSGTEVKVEITFAEKADMEKIIEMGFEAGFTMAHDNLDELLAK